MKMVGCDRTSRILKETNAVAVELGVRQSQPRWYGRIT